MTITFESDIISITNKQSAPYKGMERGIIMSKLINAERQIEELAIKALTAEQMDILHQTDYNIVQESNGQYKETYTGYTSDNVDDVIDSIINSII